MRHRLSLWGALLALPLITAAFAISGCSKDNLTSPNLATDPPATVDVSGADAPDMASLTSAEDDAILHHCPRRAVPIDGPTVIDEPGIYRVVEDFSVDEATGDGIVVRANGVLLWLGDHTITGPGAKIGRGIVLDQVRHVLVHGGRLESFGVGVALEGSTRCAVRGVRVEGADEFADPPSVPPQVGVLLVNSAYNRVARNRLEDINLGLFVRGGGSHDNVLRLNDVRGGVNGLLGVCYNPAPDAGPEGPTHDRVAANRLWRFGKGIQASAGSAENYFVGNWIGYFTMVWEDLNGTNVFRNNRTQRLTL
jgi:hypothetical protein